MTDREPLEHMLIFGGRIAGPYSKLGKKPFWTWSTHGYHNVEAFLAVTRSWLSPRRIAQIEKSLERKPVATHNAEPCGRNSVAGYAAHRSLGGPPCSGCREAYNAYHRSRGTNRRLSRKSDRHVARKLANQLS